LLVVCWECGGLSSRHSAVVVCIECARGGKPDHKG